MAGECSEGVGIVEPGLTKGLFSARSAADNGRRLAPSTMSPRLNPRLLTRRWLDSAGAPKSSSTKLLPRFRARSSKLLLRARLLNTLDMGRGVHSWNGEPNRVGWLAEECGCQVCAFGCCILTSVISDIVWKDEPRTWPSPRPSPMWRDCDFW